MFTFTLELQFIIDLDLLGFVYHWGLDVNSITVIGELYSQQIIRNIALADIHALFAPTRSTTPNQSLFQPDERNVKLCTTSKHVADLAHLSASIFVSFLVNAPLT